MLYSAILPYFPQEFKGFSVFGLLFDCVETKVYTRTIFLLQKQTSLKKYQYCTKKPEKYGHFSMGNQGINGKKPVDIKENKSYNDFVKKITLIK